MERDFMGLKSKDFHVKEEPVEVLKLDPGFLKSSAVQWSFANTGDASSNRQAGEAQGRTVHQVPVFVGAWGRSNRNFSHDSLGGTHFAMTPLPVHHNAHRYQTVSLSNPFVKANLSGASKNLAGVPTKQQLLGGFPVIPSAGSLAGTIEPWFSSKASGAPAQLTIFYGGSVHVYEDISPEKAQAIMLLAGNKALNAGNASQQRSQALAPTPKVAGGDFCFAKQPVNTSLCSGLSSPISVSSHPVGLSVGGPTSPEEHAKTMGGLTIPVSNVDTPRVMTSLRPLTVAAVLSSAVPQARKASLARFLEKRKERVMNSASAPYTLSKKPAECETSAGSSLVQV